MKVGIYTDLHISKTSSIMPLFYKDSKYTTRLQMIIDTAKWMYKVFSDNEVSLILNGGDTLDSHTVKSEEISALSEFYSYSKGIPEIHIPGNHEIFSENMDFYSSSILGDLPFITLYDKPSIVNDKISVIPYMNSDLITSNMLSSISNKILLSHIDINGSHLRPEYIMDTGVNPELLAEYFDVTINGHLHTAETIPTSKNKVYNIGNITSISFSDNNEYIPSICIIDTDTLEIKRFNNPFAILFRRFSASSVDEVIKRLNNYDSRYKYIFKITVPYEISSKVRDIVSSVANIVSYRIVSNMSGYKNVPSISPGLVDKSDSIEDEFKDYLRDNSESLHYPLEKYLEVLGKLQEV